MKYIRFFNSLNINDIAIVGGKNASLGEMYQRLTPKGINIPDGFATTSDAYWLLLEDNSIKDKIEEALKGLNISDTLNLQKCGLAVRKLILNSSLPKILEDELREAYAILSKEYNSDSVDVAVRSSGTAEDLPDASLLDNKSTF